MGLFSKLFGNPASQICAPVAGKATAVSDVRDTAFAAELLGKGIAIYPSEGKITAPCNAKVDMMFETGHAVSLIADFGAEILIHVGLDTVNLKGKHYTAHVKAGDEVCKGQLLIEFDPEAIKAEGYDIITPIVVCNSDDYKTFTTHIGGNVAVGEVIIEVSK